MNISNLYTKRNIGIKDYFVKLLRTHKYRKVISYSGKGGTGKTLTAANLSIRFARLGFNTGLLDLDLEMSSILRTMGIDAYKVTENIDMEEQLLTPPTYRKMGNLKIFSLSLMPFISDHVKETIVWGGEYQREYIFQMIDSVDWGNLDVMVIDAPAGISDTILALNNIYEKIEYAVVTGQNNFTSSDGIVKAVSILEDNNIPLAGIIANQAYYVCPHCDKRTHPLGKNMIKTICKENGYPYAGPIPLSYDIAKGMEEGDPYVKSETYSKIVKRIVRSDSRLKKRYLKYKKKR